MEPFTFDYENLHLRVDRAVFELFNLHSPAQTFRVPLRWLGVLLYFRKPGKPGELSFGVVHPSAALHSTARPDFRFTTTQAVRVSPGDESLCREYLTVVAQLADRSVV